jgi:hypothetical protein
MLQKFIVNSSPHVFLLREGRLQGGRKENRNLRGELVKGSGK